MNSSEINRILNRNSITRSCFIGCYASNQIPSHLNYYPHCMVVNLDPSWLQGSHWIAIYCQSPNEVDYYDPLGFWPPISRFICKFLSGFESLHYNNMRFQSSNSNTCGLHAVYFLYHRCAGMSFKEIIRRFQENSLHKIRPDDIVKNFFWNEIFNKI